MKRHSQRGIALVVTLIMLSVITLLAVAFLAISRRNKESVGTSQSQTDARAMSDAALARAEADLISRMFSTVIVPTGTTNTVNTTNLLNFDLAVSTTYMNPDGFLGGVGSPVNPTNVNFDHYWGPGNVTPLFGDDVVRNIGNLSRDSRVPVYIVTNSAFPNALDFRFYLDLNRNGVFDTNGTQPLLDNLGNVVGTGQMTGDPEWIGVLERPDWPHSGTNRFIGRYCYLILPVGKSLDLNFIHNQAKLGNITQDGFLRNQGYGSWELNLAGFLADLNTNYWNTAASPYFYNTNLPPLISSGNAFDDAHDLLRFRYSPTRTSINGDYNTLQSAQNYFSPAIPNDFLSDSIDNYANGPLVTANSFDESLAWPAANSDAITAPWSGSDNTNSFYTLHDELFDSNKITAGFVGRLSDAGKQVDSYDRFTFYRLLSQMAVDSAPERDKKININYKDQANFVRWTNSVEFFTNAALKLLSVHYGKDVTNIYIPIYNSNPNARTNYAPEIHRLLQVSANIYDATTTNEYPSVFRPLFASEITNGVTNVYIYNFMDQNAEAVPTNVWSKIPKLASDSTLVFDDVVSGVPFVVGAKKGIPNLNEISLSTLVKVTRLMDVRKPSKTVFWKKGMSVAGWETNLIYDIAIKNMIGVEAWNSYLQNYPRTVTMMASNQLIVNLTNQFGTTVCVTNSVPGGKLPATWVPGGVFPKQTATNVTLQIGPGQLWPGMGFRLPIANEITNLISSQFVLPGTIANGFYEEAVSSAWESNNNKGLYFYIPEWGLQMTNRLRYMLADNGKIIDFVNTGDMIVTNSIYDDLNSGDELNLWNTNRAPGSSGNNSSNKAPTAGMQKQISVALGDIGVSPSTWQNYGNSLQDKDCSIEAFYAFIFGPPSGTPPIGSSCSAQISTATNRAIWQVPFTACWYLSYSNSWQANDPLVHYTVADLKYISSIQQLVSGFYDSFSMIKQSNLGQMNPAYCPWGGNPDSKVPANSDYDFKLKDALIKQSSDWDFPTNLFPSIGYLGRVHRGTPWQTIYLKADVSPLNEWLEWNGPAYTNKYLGNVPIGGYTHPTNDWPLVDMFTTAPNDNASRGLLSVNQKGLAAWSAALSGVIVLSNSVSDALIQNGVPTFTPQVIQPGSPQLLTIYSAITNWGSNGFTHLGDVLAVPQLTTQSPFLTNTASQVKYGISDAAYERIPQQILSLLKLGDARFVIYVWGQSLKPAENSIVFNPPPGRPDLQNVCTNYQITGEVAARAVVHIEKRTSSTNTTYQGVVDSYNILPGD